MKHVRTHEAVTASECWYGDGPPLMHPSLSAAKTARRRVELVDLLEKAATKSNSTGDRKQGRILKRLATKLDRCRRDNRCGSLACPECAAADHYFPGYKIIAPSQVVGAERNLEQLRRQLTAVMVRRPKSVLKLPPKTREIVEIDIEDNEFWSLLNDHAKCLRQLQQR